MGQNFHLSKELNHGLEEMKAHQRLDVLLCIDEILTVMDMASPAVDQWKAARRSFQLGEGSKLDAMTSVSTGAGHGESARDCN